MFDLIVIGGGPAGIMASITAAKSGHKVLLIEKNSNLGKKLLLTGGGRCNLTNLKSSTDFLNETNFNKKWLYSCLSSFGPKEIYSYFNELGVKLKEEDNGRIFPISNKATEILEALCLELEEYKVNINQNETVSSITLDGHLKIIKTNKECYKTKNVIVATGGLSYPKTGSTGDGLNFAKEINQPITKIYPAETYLVLKNKLPFSGITFQNVRVKLNDVTKEGSLLFTHKGLSGPSIFKISEHVYKELINKKTCFIYLDLIPTVEDFLPSIFNYNQKSELKTFLKQFLPQKMINYLLELNSLDGSKKLATISKNEVDILRKSLKELKLEVTKTGSIEEAFVTSGGVDLALINPSTMESKIHKGIYFVGEVLDVHGPTGGYNITIALSTGHKAGTNIT